MFKLKPAFLLLALSIVLALRATLTAQTGLPVDDPVHNELRALRTDLLIAIDKGDIDAMLTRMTPTVVITWQNGEVCRGKNEVKAFYQRMAASGKKTFQGYIKPPSADELTTLYSGTTGVVVGDSIGRYFLLGREIELPNRWTATLVKADGRWLLAGYHVSMNVLDNPLLNTVKKTSLVIGTVALLSGLGLGFWIGRKRLAPVVV